MKNVLPKLLALGLCLTAPVFADWGDIHSIEGIKHWTESDREVHILGTIREVYGSDGILLTDDTGEIHVHFTNSALRDYGFRPGQRVEVRGLVERRPYYHEHHHWDSHHWELEANAVKLHDGDGAIIGY